MKYLISVFNLILMGCNTQSFEIYVSPTGNVTNTGLQDSSLSTIQDSIKKTISYKKGNYQNETQ